MIYGDLESFDVYGIKPEDDSVFSEPSDESERENDVNDVESYDHDDDVTMQTPPSLVGSRGAGIKMINNFNYEIFTSIVSEQKFLASVFAGDKIKFDEFIRNAFLWDEFFELCKYKLFTLADFIHNEYFYKMININDQLTCDERLLPVLRELMGRKRHFIIPFVYIGNYVPKEFTKINLTTFGMSDKFPQLITKAKSEIETSNRIMRPVKDILRTYHIFYDSTTI